MDSNQEDFIGISDVPDEPFQWAAQLSAFKGSSRFYNEFCEFPLRHEADLTEEELTQAVGQIIHLLRRFSRFRSRVVLNSRGYIASVRRAQSIVRRWLREREVKFRFLIERWNEFERQERRRVQGRISAFRVENRGVVFQKAAQDLVTAACKTTESEKRTVLKARRKEEWAKYRIRFRRWKQATQREEFIQAVNAKKISADDLPWLGQEDAEFRHRTPPGQPPRFIFHTCTISMEALRTKASKQRGTVASPQGPTAIQRPSGVITRRKATSESGANSTMGWCQTLRQSSFEDTFVTAKQTFSTSPAPPTGQRSGFARRLPAPASALPFQGSLASSSRHARRRWSACQGKELEAYQRRSLDLTDQPLTADKSLFRDLASTGSKANHHSNNNNNPRTRKEKKKPP